MLKPLEWFLSFLFTEIYNLSGNYGISLLALSIMVNLILLPIYIPLDRKKLASGLLGPAVLLPARPRS